MQGKTLGVIAKDAGEGEFLAGWGRAVKGAELESLDIAVPMGLILAPKDEMELGLIRTAATVSAKLWMAHLRKQIIQIINDDKKTKHEKLSEGCEAALKDRTVVGAVATANLEPCFPAIIQSGGAYSHKFSATSDKAPLHFGAIAATFGARYKLYCSAVARTMLVDPSKNVEEVL